MAPFNANELKDLLVQEKWDEAKNLLEAYLSAPLTKEEKGAAYVAFVMTYIDVMHRLNRDYEDKLNEALESLQVIDVAEQELTDKINAAKIPASPAGRRVSAQRA